MRTYKKKEELKDKRILEVDRTPQRSLLKMEKDSTVA